MEITSAAQSHTGRRTNNEDSFTCQPGLGLHAVADRMGGYDGGEEASRLAVEALEQCFTKVRQDEQATWPYAADPERSLAENLIAVGVRLANQRVLDRKVGPLSKMGSTVAVLAPTGAAASLCNRTVVPGMDSGPRAPTRPFPKLLAVAKLGPRLGVARAPTDGAAERTPLAAGLGTLVSRVRTRLRATPSEGPRSGWAAIAGLGLVYFVAAKLGLQLAYLHASATAVWAPTGIAVAALLRLGCGVWPGIFLGAFLANVTTAGSVATSIGIGLGNTLEGVVAALLVERFAGSMRTAGRPRDLLLFALLAAGLSTTLSATAGVGTLSLAGYAAWRDFRAIWTTWWLGDAVGCLVVAPALLSWTSALQPRWTRLRALEAAALAAAVALSGGLTFAGVVPQVGFGLQFLCFPVLVWAAFRFGQRETASALLLLSAIAIGGTLQGAGPFARTSPHEALLLLQAFIGVTAVTALVLAAVVTDHRRLEEELRKQAETDPLTGLTNYRQLVRTLDQEVRRALRTGRPFALLLFDLDRLKELNDRHGHQEGSRALQRVAEAMRASCRALDTAARQGGDEFALVLPETDRASALLVSGRIQALLASDPHEPRISVSAGVAEFPADGGSSEALIRAADGVLYRAKRSRR